MPSECAVVITGSAGGIGQALVHAFAAEGYHVIGVDRVPTDGGARSLEFDLERLGSDGSAVAELSELLDAALQGRSLTALVNNAATQILGSVEDLTLADFRATLHVNLLSAFALVKVCLGPLKAARGAVINIGSIHAKLTKPRFSAYAASKGGLESLTRALAVELGSAIRVNGISPAAVDTPMLRDGFVGAPEAYRTLAQCHPAERVAQPAEIAELALFLASGKAGFVNGSVVEMHGGIGGRLHDPD